VAKEKISLGANSREQGLAGLALARLYTSAACSKSKTMSGAGHGERVFIDVDSNCVSHITLFHSEERNYIDKVGHI